MCHSLRDLEIPINRPALAGEKKDLMDLFGVGKLLSCLRGLDKVIVDLDWCPLDAKTDTFIEALEVLKLPHESSGLALDTSGVRTESTKVA